MFSTLFSMLFFLGNMIAISNSTPIENEINLIHQLFSEGLLLFHVRKSDFSETEMETFLIEIGIEYRGRLVLHSYHQLAERFGINRIHFTEKMRKETSEKKLKLWKGQGFRLTTSVHTMEVFNDLNSVFDYAFLSPIYPSISKPDYISNINHFEAIKNRSNFSTKLVALGGISSKNIQQTLENGFDDVALLGSIWKSNKLIENFKKCQKIALSY